MPPKWQDYRWMPHLPGFYVGSGDLNSSFHACLVNTFFHQLTSPSLWLVFWYWNGPGQILDYLNGITTYAANS